MNANKNKAPDGGGASAGARQRNPAVEKAMAELAMREDRRAEMAAEKKQEEERKRKVTVLRFYEGGVL